MTNPLNHTTTLTYDTGDLASVTNPLGNTTTRFTDGVGPLISATSPGGQFAYDANGNLLSVTDARTSVTSYAYWTMDRPAFRKAIRSC